MARTDVFRANIGGPPDKGAKRNSVLGTGKIPKYVKPRNADINEVDFSSPLEFTDADQFNWAVDYIKSPKYLEKLSKQYKDPKAIQNKRIREVLNTSLDDVNGEHAGANYGGENRIELNNKTLRSLGLKRNETVMHELAHLYNSNFESRGLHMTPEEERYLYGKEKVFGKYNTQNPMTGPLKYANDKKYPLSRVVNQIWEMHDFAPDELKSDVESLRYLLDKEGVYNPRKGEINKEMLEKAKNNWRIKDSFIFDRLKGHYTDDDLIEIMNSVTKNKSTNKSTMA